jgi:tRNA A-37 threonylcarbamoyl transferase component Bud32
MSDDDFESRVLAFEQQWRLGGPCEIARYLNSPIALTGQDRLRLLVELICIDLEYCWRAQSVHQTAREPALLEGYATKYPELGPFQELPLELIGQEYRMRWQFGDRPSHSGFLERFRRRHEEVRTELLRIDRELKEEVTSSRPAASMQRPGIIVDRPPDVRLLAHHDFLLRRMIGSGRMGKVYEAWQHSLERAVAVKFLRKSFLNRPEVVQRFIYEANIVARLRHANIVEIHGLGRTPAGAHFIVMELVSDSNLDRLSLMTSISVEFAIQLAIQLCGALEHAHSKGIIHCDLKPANLLLDKSGCLKVTDFGLSRCMTEHLSWSAEIEGTAPFMAPEQASRHWGPIDVHTDVYGVGAVLYTLLTGRPPWVGQRLPDILADVISAAPVIPPTDLRPELPECISDLCRKCLAKAPKDRYETVRDLRSALAAARALL